MWSRLFQRLTDPVFYRKRARQVWRRIHPGREPVPVSLDSVLPAQPGRNLLVVIAHPDDELFASGLIREAVARNLRVEIICLTRGEGGPTGESSRASLGQCREGELRVSAAALGVASVTFLGQVDPVGLAHRTFAPAIGTNELAERLRCLFDARRPTAIVTHGSGGEYWHPAHLLLHAAVFRAVGGHPHPLVPVLTFNAWQPGHSLPGLLNRDDPADLVIDTERHRESRLAALRAHRSQREFFSRLGGGSLEGFIDRTSREGYRLYPAPVREPAPGTTPPADSLPASPQSR